MPVWSDVAEMSPYLERFLESVMPTSAPIDQNRWKNAVAYDGNDNFAATGKFWRTNMRSKMANLKLYTDREAEAVVKDEKEKIQEVRCIQKKRMAVEDQPVRTDQAITKKEKKMVELNFELIWRSCGKTLMDEIERIHVRAAKIIYKVDRSTPSDQVLVKANWNTIRDMNSKCLPFFAYKCYYGHVPKQLQSIVRKSNYTYDVKRKLSLVLPVPKSNYVRNSIL